MRRWHLRQSAALTLTLLLLALTSLGLAGTAIADDADDDDDRGRRARLATSLVGEEEVPGPGDPDGRGNAKLRINTTTGEICYKLKVRRIQPATAAHIHIGRAGTAGPVVQDLMPPTNGSSSGCVINPPLARQLVADPENYYVNVHNTAFPAGAVRGQLDDGDDDD